MSISLFVRCACIIAFGMSAVAAEAKEVTFQHKGLTLNAISSWPWTRHLPTALSSLPTAGSRTGGNYSGGITESGLAR